MWQTLSLTLVLLLVPRTQVIRHSVKIKLLYRYWNYKEWFWYKGWVENPWVLKYHIHAKNIIVNKYIHYILSNLWQVFTPACDQSLWNSWRLLTVHVTVMFLVKRWFLKKFFLTHPLFNIWSFFLICGPFSLSRTITVNIVNSQLSKSVKISWRLLNVYVHNDLFSRGDFLKLKVF